MAKTSTLARSTLTVKYALREPFAACVTTASWGDLLDQFLNFFNPLCHNPQYVKIRAGLRNTKIPP